MLSIFYIYNKYLIIKNVVSLFFSLNLLKTNIKFVPYINVLFYISNVKGKNLFLECHCRNRNPTINSAIYNHHIQLYILGFNPKTLCRFIMFSKILNNILAQKIIYY